MVHVHCIMFDTIRAQLTYWEPDQRVQQSPELDIEQWKIRAAKKR